MQTEQSVFIKKNLDLLNSKKFDIDMFITSMFDTILSILRKATNLALNIEDIRSKFILHLKTKSDLYFDSSGMFCSYLLKFAKNINSVELRYFNRLTELDDTYYQVPSTEEGLIEEPSVIMFYKNTGLTITELSKILNTSRQLLYFYIDKNEMPFEIKQKIKELNEFHNSISKANELKELIHNHFGHLKEEAFEIIGVNRTYLFKACNTGISYTQYIKVKEKLSKHIPGIR